jgi:hypothetical protein
MIRIRGSVGERRGRGRSIPIAMPGQAEKPGREAVEFDDPHRVIALN